MEHILFRLLAIFAIAGLLSAPMVSAAAGKTVESNRTHAALTHMTSMPDGMPCCPHEKQTVPDCQKNCLFAALCASQCVAAIPAETVLFLQKLTQAELVSLHNDGLLDQRSVTPPQRPPRT
jgi:hypothetical protein